MRLIKAPLIAGLLTVVILGARTYLPQWAYFVFLEQCLFFFCGLITGIRLPDWDLLLPGFSHRSGITHSCMISAIVFLFGMTTAAGGLAMGTALHLASDLQPKAWSGGALIKLSFIGSIGLLSPVWLLANIVGCTMILMQVMMDLSFNDRQLIVLVTVTGIGWYFYQEEKRPLLPVITLAFSFLLVHAVRNGTLSMKVIWNYLA